MAFRGKVVFLTAKEAAAKEQMMRNSGNRAGDGATGQRAADAQEQEIRDLWQQTERAKETSAKEQKMRKSGNAGICGSKPPTQQHRPGTIDGNIKPTTATRTQERRDSSGRRRGDLEFNDDIGKTTARKQPEERGLGVRRRIDNSQAHHGEDDARPTEPKARHFKPMDLQELRERFEMHFGAYGDAQCEEGLMLWDMVTSALDTVHGWIGTRMIDVNLMCLGFGAELLAESCEELSTVQLVAKWSGYGTLVELVESLQTSLPLLEEVRRMWAVGIPTGLHHGSLMGALLVRDPHEYGDYLRKMRSRYEAEEGEGGDSWGEELGAERVQDGDMDWQPGVQRKGSKRAEEGEVQRKMQGEEAEAGRVQDGDSDREDQMGCKRGEEVEASRPLLGEDSEAEAGRMQEGDEEGLGRERVGHKPHTQTRRQRVRRSLVGRSPPPFPCGRCGRGGYRPNNRQRWGVERLWERGGETPLFPPRGCGLERLSCGQVVPL